MNISLFILVLCSAEFGVLVGAWCAHRDRFFSVSEMLGRGIPQGLPFADHAGMWGDLLIVSPIIAFIAAQYSSDWSLRDYVMAGVSALVTTAIMHLLYTKIDFPESHTQNGRLTKAGWIHFAYMAFVLEYLILFYFHTQGVSLHVFYIISGLLVFHQVMSNHIILEIMRPKWYGKSHFKDSLFILSTLAVVALMVWRYYAFFIA